MSITKPPSRNLITPAPAGVSAIEFRKLSDRFAALEERVAALEDVIRIQRHQIEIMARVPLRITAPRIDVAAKTQTGPNIFGRKIAQN